MSRARDTSGAELSQVFIREFDSDPALPSLQTLPDPGHEPALATLETPLLSRATTERVEFQFLFGGAAGIGIPAPCLGGTFVISGLTLLGLRNTIRWARSGGR